jgi:hypothetical protein
MARRSLGPGGGVFISYRREETAYPAAWLYDRLRDRLGSEAVFKDVDNLEAGDDFVAEITAAVGSCDVLLALIGPNWATLTNAEGVRRLDDPGDFVRVEIEAALSRNIKVIPLLVSNATMPAPEQLPPSLSPLTRRHAIELSPSRFNMDAERLIVVVERTLREIRGTPPGAQDGRALPEDAPEGTPRSVKIGTPASGGATRHPRRRKPFRARPRVAVSHRATRPGCCPPIRSHDARSDAGSSRRPSSSCSQRGLHSPGF